MTFLILLLTGKMGQTSKKTQLTETERVTTAIIAVFPTVENLTKFSGNNKNKRVLDSLITLAHTHKIIAKADSEAFSNFIQSNSRVDKKFTLPESLNFDLFLAQKNKLLETNLSLRTLAEDTNRLLTCYNIGLPKVTSTMLSRLKKEPADTDHKKNVLRSIAFWIGYNRKHLASKWNSETLFEVCRSVKLTLKSTFGVRVGFALSARGDVIDQEILAWLKNKVKSHVDNALALLSYSNWGKIREKDITTLYVDFPKEDATQNPTTYRQSMRNAISLAHQIAIQWALAPYCSQNRFLAIGIAAGEFVALGHHLMTILNTRLPGDPVIRLTDFSHQCTQINDIRASFCTTPKEITLLSGESLNIWWVTGVWTPLYFDFVPELLEDPLLQVSTVSNSVFYSYFFGISDDDDTTSSSNIEIPNAVLTFMSAPHNFLLGLEIAKTLYYRRRFWEAIQIIRIILSLDPIQIHARAFLIKLYSNLALEAPTQAIAEGFFEEAKEEAEFILENCFHHSEDFYCEYAGLHLTIALVTLRFLRNNVMDGKNIQQLSLQKQRVFDNLTKADKLFHKGTLMSPLNIRASFLRNNPKIIKCILKHNDAVFTDPKLDLDSDPEPIREVITNYQWQYGGLRKEIPNHYQSVILKRLFDAFINNHDAAISLRAYHATTAFCAAVVWWDLFPVRTVGIAKKAIELLKKARKIAEDMARKDIGIYSFTRVYGEMLSAEEYVEHMSRSIEMIENYCGDDLKRRKDKQLLTYEDTDRLSPLMTLNF